MSYRLLGVLSILALSSGLLGCASDEATPGSDAVAAPTAADSGVGAAPDASPEDLESGAPDAREPEDVDQDGMADVPTSDPAAPTADAAAADSGPTDLPRAERPDPALGGDRPAKTTFPDAYLGRDDWPLVILLHGFTATGPVQDFYFGFSRHADELGFVALVPDGTKNLSGQQFWNATPACCDYDGLGVDDEGYLNALIDEARERLRVDPERVYLLGHSNGGFMSHRMACNQAPRVRAIASLAGSTFNLESRCTPSEPVSVLQLHGTQDLTISIEGSFGYPSARTTVERWAALDGCDPTSVVEERRLDLDVAVEGAETTVERWTGCDDDVEVALWTMIASGHIPGASASFIPEIVGWLLAR